MGAARRLENCLAIDMVVAWRIQHLTWLGRETPDMPCTAFFEDAEWKALVGFIHQTPVVPATPPTLKAAIIMVATLGGFLNRNPTAIRELKLSGVDYSAWTISPRPISPLSYPLNLPTMRSHAPKVMGKDEPIGGEGWGEGASGIFEFFFYIFSQDIFRSACNQGIRQDLRRRNGRSTFFSRLIPCAAKRSDWYWSLFSSYQLPNNWKF